MFFSQYDKGSLRKLPLKMVMVKSELPPSPPSGSHLNCLGDRVELSKSESISGMDGAVGGGEGGRVTSSISSLHILSFPPNLQARTRCLLCRAKKEPAQAL